MFSEDHTHPGGGTGVAPPFSLGVPLHRQRLRIRVDYLRYPTVMPPSLELRPLTAKVRARLIRPSKVRSADCSSQKLTAASPKLWRTRIVRR